MSKEDHILSSWKANSQQWVEVIANDEIQSRQLITNRAIQEAILAHQPQRVLDVGCGEGWLTRALVEQGIEGIGLDGVEGLIEAARKKGGAEFHVLEYKDFTSENLRPLGQFDVIVFNYALFGNEIVEKVLKNLRENLTSEGKIIIQTIHPKHSLVADYTEPTWLKENWAGLKRDFQKGYDWYFRPLAAWKKLFEKLSYQWKSSSDIRHPQTQDFISIIMEVSG
jgi:2-polyprenyl-3-methyl-5-hydroxy-6-metoxy-1,4-benzoquinol methylase